MSKILTISGQRGGSGKSVTALNLAVSLSLFEKKVLLVDCDPQGCSTEWSGINSMGYPFDLASVLNGKATVIETIAKTEFNYMDILPAGFDLFSVGLKLSRVPANEKILRLLMDDVRTDYDYIILDAPSSYGYLSIAALTAADGLLITMCPQQNWVEDFHCLLKTIQYIRQTHDIPLKITGLLFNQCKDPDEVAGLFADGDLADTRNLVYSSFIPEDGAVNKAIELDEDEEIEEIDEDDELEEIEVDEDEEIEEIELDEDEEIEEVDELEDEDIEEIELDEDEEIEEIDEDDELEEIEVDEDEEIEEIELDEDEDIEEVDALEDEEIEEVGLDEDEEIEEIDEDDELEEIEELEIDEDQELDEIELDEDEELEEVDELDEEELQALEDFRESRELAEHFDDTLGDREKKYNAYIKIPKGLYTIGTKKALKASLELQQFEMPMVYIGKYPVTNSLFEIFIEQTGYVTTAEKKGSGTVYHARYQKNGNTASWRKEAGSQDVKGACWYQPTGPGSTLHEKRNHPVVQISVDDAFAYASWIGRRIPTEAEWEAAARTDLGLQFPWGNQFDPKALNIEKTGFSDTCPVDTYDGYANEFGVADVLGNIMEWTSAMEFPPFKTRGNHKYCVAKGGAWNAGNTISISSRGLFKKDFTANTIGFRCISELFQ